MDFLLWEGFLHLRLSGWLPGIRMKCCPGRVLTGIRVCKNSHREVHHVPVMVPTENFRTDASLLERRAKVLTDKAGLVGWLHPHAWIAVIIVAGLVLRRDVVDVDAFPAHRIDVLHEIPRIGIVILLCQPAAIEGVVCFHPGGRAPRACDDGDVRIYASDCVDDRNQALLFPVDGKHPEGGVRIVTVGIAAGVVEVRCSHTNANHGKACSRCGAEQSAQCFFPSGVRHAFHQEKRGCIC